MAFVSSLPPLPTLPKCQKYGVPHQFQNNISNSSNSLITIASSDIVGHFVAQQNKKHAPNHMIQNTNQLCQFILSRLKSMPNIEDEYYKFDIENNILLPLQQNKHLTLEIKQQICQIQKNMWNQGAAALISEAAITAIINMGNTQT